MHKHCKWLVNGCRVYVMDTLHWHTGETDCVALHLHNSSPSRTSPQHSIQSVILLGSGHGQWAWAGLLHRVAHKTSDLSANSSIARQHVWRYNATWSYIGQGRSVVS